MKCVSRVVALIRLRQVNAASSPASVAVALPQPRFLTLALHGITGRRGPPLDGYLDDRLRMMLETRPTLLITAEDAHPL